MIMASDWRAIKRLEQTAERLGMKLVPARFGTDFLALIPDGNKLPVFARDAEIACGSVEHLESVLQGWDKAFTYLTVLRMVSEDKVKKKEEQYMQERTLHKLKTGQNLP